MIVSRAAGTTFPLGIDDVKSAKRQRQSQSSFLIGFHTIRAKMVRESHAHQSSLHLTQHFAIVKGEYHNYCNIKILLAM